MEIAGLGLGLGLAFCGLILPGWNLGGVVDEFLLGDFDAASLWISSTFTSCSLGFLFCSGKTFWLLVFAVLTWVIGLTTGFTADFFPLSGEFLAVTDVTFLADERFFTG